MFDLNDYDSISIIEKVLEEIKYWCPDDVKILVIGNKTDLKTNVNKEDLKKIIDNNKLKYIEISVKNDNNKFKDFFNILEEMLIDLPKNIKKKKMLELNIDENVKQKKCCNIL